MGERSESAGPVGPLTTSPETRHSPVGEAESLYPNCWLEEDVMKQVESLMTLTDLSEMLGVPVGTLCGWRHRGEGPPRYRVCRHVRYRRAAVEAWLETCADGEQLRR